MAEQRTGAAHLTVHDLSVHYGRAQALQAVSVTVRPGGITAVIGSNGAGKSTLLKAVAGVVPATAGSVWLDGDDVTGAGTAAIVARGVALVPEGRRLFGDLTVEENLRVGGYRLRRSRGPNMEEVLEYFPDLKPKLRTRARYLSGGQQQMLAIGRALMSRPRLLMLDEPCTGLAPVVVKRIARLFSEIAANGVTVLLIEQNATIALDVSDHCYVLETGRVVVEGSSRELASHDFVARAYLGT